MGWIKANPDDELHGKIKAYRDHPDTNANSVHEAAVGLLRRGVIDFEFEGGELVADE